MANTANLDMPLLAQSQAQKHVTVNEALNILDSVAQLTLESLTLTSPPSDPIEGQGYGLPGGLSGAWSWQKGKIAIFSNGGWVFVTPKAGWKAYVKDEARAYLHDGTDWQSDAIVTSPNGAGFGMEVFEFDYTVGTGTTLVTSQVIPAYTTVYGVTARVLETLWDGTLGSWRLGVAESISRYGSGLRLNSENIAFGLTGTPITYYTDTPLVLTAKNGAFNGGKVRLSIHLMHLNVPRS